MNNLDPWETPLSDQEFQAIRHLVHRTAGISLTNTKQAFVQSRLRTRLIAIGVNSYADYVTYVTQEKNGAELHAMVEALTTHHTRFFRESDHLDLLAKHLSTLPVNRTRNLRLWSAACSTGEEPYSIAMIVAKCLPQRTVARARILATDISTKSLVTARAGVYGSSDLSHVPEGFRTRYFAPDSPPHESRYRICDSLRTIVRFARLNLMHPWPMQGPFEVVFCRNVMIYFDASTRLELASRITQFLHPQGLLFIGNAESLGIAPPGLRLIVSSVYQRTTSSISPREAAQP